MKRKITRRYLFVFTVSVTLIIAIWLGLTYVVLFHDALIDKSMPQYIAHMFEKYIVDESLTINDQGKKLLEENALWAQVVDKRGNVIDSFNSPEEASERYDIFKMSCYILNSDAMEGQTIYLSKFKYKQNYGIIVGCNSSRLAKYNIQFKGGTVKYVVTSGIILISLFVLVGIIAGIIFSRTISSPVQDIIANINNLEADINLEPRKYKKNLFSSVYDSLQKLQTRLKSADRERANAERQKNEWISNISHDMRTPLSSIKGYAEIMFDDDYDISTDERKLFSGIIIKNSENIDGLIQELKFNRLFEDGTLALNKEELNLNSLIKECCEELPTQYSKQKITIETNSQLVYLPVDRQLMKRCFTNLICNAFVHNNGEVNVNIEIFREDKTIFIKIADDGKGMTEEEADKIFNRYYRGVSSKRNVGSGLGLAIVKEIVEAHGGEISVQSEKGKGTTFILHL